MGGGWQGRISSSEFPGRNAGEGHKSEPTVSRQMMLTAEETIPKSQRFNMVKSYFPDAHV